jgi:hypothetical protein
VRHYTHMNRRMNACMLGYEQMFQNGLVPGCAICQEDLKNLLIKFHITLSPIWTLQAPYPYYISGPRDSSNLRVSNPNLKVMLCCAQSLCVSFDTEFCRASSVVAWLLHGNSFSSG